jgi:hypothetical protein
MARSPNYPNYDLTAALGQVRKVYDKDGRNKVSRAIIATHLGHESLSGPALGKIGALRAYGLLEGTGDELRVSDDALAALRAPPDSDAYKQAMARLAMKPPLFQAIRKEYPNKPSKESLAWWLEQQGYTGSAAAIAARTYLATLTLVEGVAGEYNDDDGSDEKEEPSEFKTSPPPPSGSAAKQVKVMESERVAFVEEGQPGQYLKVIASGDVDETMLEALDDYVKRQRKRLGIVVPSKPN